MWNVKMTLIASVHCLPKNGPPYVDTVASHTSSSFDNFFGRNVAERVSYQMVVIFPPHLTADVSCLQISSVRVSRICKVRDRVMVSFRPFVASYYETWSYVCCCAVWQHWRLITTWLDSRSQWGWWGSQEAHSASSQQLNQRTALMLSSSFHHRPQVWRLMGKIMGTAVCCVACDSCAQWYIHKCQQLWNLCVH